MKHRVLLLIASVLTINFVTYAQNGSSADLYSYKRGDYDGIGKWYMGREIAHVMGYQGMSWLERSEREQEERTSKLLELMDIQSDDTIADIGAGSGYHVFRMAPVAREGLIYAVDIQPQMLDAIESKRSKTKVDNITLVQSDVQDVKLPENSVDKVLMVDVYHEFSHPVEMIQSIKKALRSDGKIYLIEYRGEDPQVPIKRLHKMTEAQAVKEMKAVGLRLEENIEGLPWQHCMVFVKE